ncbi:ribonuclease J, partial [archaeon]|nr:ribonuclease J [archaeon]
KIDHHKLESINNVKCLILDSLNNDKDMKTPSEKVAREMLKDVLLGIKHENKAIVVTTFSSHLPRLKSVIDFGKKLNRKIVFLGRSLFKYIEIAEKLKLVNFSGDVEICGYRKLVEKRLHDIKKNKSKYLIVCTGNQGEKEAVLSRMSKGELPWKFENGDIVIFSCRTIPTEETIKSREILEKRLKKVGVRVFKDIHVSGHASLQDHRDLIEMLKPKHLIPTHAESDNYQGIEELAIKHLGFTKKSYHRIHDGDVIEI